MRHATYASRGECINMKRTFWMHENASKCNMSRMQQVWKCIRMQPSRIGRMQQLKVVAKCVRMQPNCRMQRVWMHAKNNEMHMNAHACIRMHMNAYGKKQHHFREKTTLHPEVKSTGFWSTCVCKPRAKRENHQGYEVPHNPIMKPRLRSAAS